MTHLSIKWNTFLFIKTFFRLFLVRHLFFLLLWAHHNALWVYLLCKGYECSTICYITEQKTLFLHLSHSLASVFFYLSCRHTHTQWTTYIHFSSHFHLAGSCGFHTSVSGGVCLCVWRCLRTCPLCAARNGEH